MQKDTLYQTPSQTVGPYFAYGLTALQYQYPYDQIINNKMVDPATEKDHIVIRGSVYDGEGNTIPDALIEVWDHENSLFGRFGTGTEPNDEFVFYTKKPSPSHFQAPYLTVIVFMRGQLLHSYTRMYFDDEPQKNAKDEILLSIQSQRRPTLLAKKQASHYQFDIWMQGDLETVFFDL